MKYIDKLVRFLLRSLMGDGLYRDKMVQRLISTGYPTILFLNGVTFGGLIADRYIFHPTLNLFLMWWGVFW